MSLELLLDEFDGLIQTPADVEKLNATILQWAVQGRLVPQCAKDEPAHSLFSRNIQHRQALERKKEIKKLRKLPKIKSEEIQSKLPNTWIWCRLGEITTYGLSEKVQPDDVTFDTWLLDLKDIEKSTSRLLRKERVGENSFKSTKSKFFSGDVLYGKLRPYLDKVLVADEDGICTTEIIPFHGFVDIDPFYLRLCLKSSRFITYANGNTYGMNLPRLKTQDARMALIPLAPYEEQKRIVARVDELMGQTAVLANQLREAEEKRRRLHETAVFHLTSPANDQTSDFSKKSDVYNLLTRNFDRFYTDPDTISDLKQAILQLAVQGRLVPQDPNDEPADECIKYIGLTKAQLRKDGKIKKYKYLLPIESDKYLYDIPEGWQWVRLGSACLRITDGFHRSPKPQSTGVPYIMATHVKSNGIDFNNSLFVAEDMHKYLWEKTRPKKGDILVVNIGAGCGTPAILDTDIEFSFKNVAILNKPDQLDSKYLFYYMLRECLKTLIS